jgi:transposase-like protein
VVILEKLYYRLLPWMKTHANYSIHHPGQVCPNCGSGKYHRRGYALTQAGSYARFQCQACGSWFRGAKMVSTKGERTISI